MSNQYWHLTMTTENCSAREGNLLFNPPRGSPLELPISCYARYTVWVRRRCKRLLYTHTSWSHYTYKSTVWGLWWWWWRWWWGWWWWWWRARVLNDNRCSVRSLALSHHTVNIPALFICWRPHSSLAQCWGHYTGNYRQITTDRLCD